MWSAGRRTSSFAPGGTLSRGSRGRGASNEIRRAAAFAVPGEELERVIVAVECRPDVHVDPVTLAAAVRSAVFAAVRLVPAHQ
jgi:hypothetical protein